MSSFEHYIEVGTKRLRCGFTTGTCAAAAARAACELLLYQQAPSVVRLDIPAGIRLELDVENPSLGRSWAQCAVQKDAGDDPDVTDGLLIYARVEWADEPGIHIEGGAGVGRVTRPGLDQPVGNAAINSVPRAMIEQQIREALAQDNKSDLLEKTGILVTISVPGGAEVAARTFNPRLGIEGGISIIGTTGVVKPMSEEALIDSIQLELKVKAAEGIETLLISPGNYGIDFARNDLKLKVESAVQCSNYLGATLDGVARCSAALDDVERCGAALDGAARCGFKSVLIVGHIGKMVKVAAGIMNTHSRVADARMETLAAHAACAQASHETIEHIMQAATTDAALEILVDNDLLAPVMESLVARIAYHVRQRLGDSIQAEIVIFSKVWGLLGMTDEAKTLMEELR